MTKKYKALKDVGCWKKGDLVGDLPEGQIKQLVADRIIEKLKHESQAPKQTVKNKEVKADV